MTSIDFRRCLAFWLVPAVVALSGSGCSEGPPKSPAAPNCELFVIVAGGLPARSYRSIQEQLLQLIANAAPADRVHLIVSEQHTVLGSFEVQPGQPRVRLRDRRCAATLRAFSEFCRGQIEPAPATPTGAGQVAAHLVSETFTQLRVSEFPVRVILVGDPVFYDESRSAWSMRGQNVISDAAIDYRSCPFHVRRRPAGPSFTTYWIAEGQWGDSVDHQVALHRFYDLYFAALGGRLAVIGSDAPSVFAKACVGGTPTGPPPQRSADPFVGKLSLARTEVQSAFEPGEVVVEVRALEAGYVVPVAAEASLPTEEQIDPPSRPAAAATPVVPASLEMALAAVSREEIGIAIRWWPRDRTARAIPANLDLDLWTTDAQAPGEVVFFSRLKGSFGMLSRDVRESDRAHDDYRDWEYLLVHHNRLADLTAYIDAYDISVPVVCQVRLANQGVIRDWQCEFDLQRGDRAGEVERREASAFWKKVPLLEIASSNP